MTTKTLLALASALEAAIGLALMAHPPLVVRMLLGGDVSGAGTAIGRVAGLALLSLGLACWPGGDKAPALRSLLAYNALAGLYLAGLGIRGEGAGPLLWPAVGVHAVLTILLARAWAGERKLSQSTW